jgi:hypothetical protein
VALAYRIANEAPTPLRERRPDIPGGLERIVMRCLERDCERRFPDARALATALEPYRTHGAGQGLREPAEDDETTVMDSPRAEPPIASASADESLVTSSVSWGRSQRAPALTRRRRQAMVVALATIGVALTVAIALTRSEPVVTPRAAATPTSPPAATLAAALNAPASVVSLVPLLEPTASSEPPTVSVTDLPSVAIRPVPVSAPAPLAPAPAAAPKVDPDGILAASPAPAPASSKVVPRPGPPAIRTDLPNCSPPFYYDELGLKIFKPECVN